MVERLRIWLVGLLVVCAFVSGVAGAHGHGAVVGAAPAGAAAPVAAAATFKAWVCGASPELRFKGVISGNGKNSVSAAGGTRADTVLAVGVDGKNFLIWFQELSGAGGPGFRSFPWNVPGFDYQGGTGHQLEVVGYQAFIHHQPDTNTERLKIMVTHFRGSKPGTDQDDPNRDLYVYDTGCELPGGS